MVWCIGIIYASDIPNEGFQRFTVANELAVTMRPTGNGQITGR